MSKKIVKYNKTALTQDILSFLKGTRVQAEEVVDLVFNKMIEHIDNGEQVSIAGFGSFFKKEAKAREARNPKTGAKVKVPAHFKMKFTPAKALKEVINEAK